MGEFFPRFFDPIELGKSLKEVATDVIATTHADVIGRWFHSSKDADLFIWLDKKQNIIKQQLSYYGQVVEWNAVEGVKTGHIVVDENRGRARESEILCFDESPQVASVQQAVDLLSHITALTSIERDALLRNFTEEDPGTLLSAEEFISRFGALTGEPVNKGLPVRGWKALIRKVLRWFKP